MISGKCKVTGLDVYMRRKQEQLIQKLSKDYPETLELEEYRDYQAAPTKASASAVISTALEVNWPQVSRQDGYAQYIATRPRAEKLGKHGLFGEEDAVDLTQAMTELEQYPGNVWTHILSLKREAEQQNPWAEYALAKEYLAGTTLEKNPEKAVSLLLDAGEAGNCYTEYLLGKLYLSGQVLPMDQEAAETWLGRASYDGHPWAAFLLDRVQDPQPQAVELALTMVKLVAQICRTFENHTQPVTPLRPRMDRKAWEKLIRQRLAMGHRLDDHEDPKMDEVNQRL